MPCSHFQSVQMLQVLTRPFSCRQSTGELMCKGHVLHLSDKVIPRQLAGQHATSVTSQRARRAPRAPRRDLDLGELPHNGVATEVAEEAQAGPSNPGASSVVDAAGALGNIVAQLSHASLQPEGRALSSSKSTRERNESDALDATPASVPRGADENETPAVLRSPNPRPSKRAMQPLHRQDM